MSGEEDWAPLRYTLHVNGNPQDVFDRFTDLDAWWPRHHKVGQSTIAALVMAPHMSGVIKEIGDDGVETVWGYITSFERPDRFAFRWTCDTFWKGSETIVTFARGDLDQVNIELIHDRLDCMPGSAADLLASFGRPTGWRDILDSFSKSMR